MREPGFYWIREFKGADWEPAEWGNFERWNILSSEESLSEVFEVGPKIEPPNKDYESCYMDDEGYSDFLINLKDEL